jgi:hypothetical protein
LAGFHPAPQSALRFLGIAALFAWLAIALYNVTQDSFATPNIWVIPGIMAGLSINATEKQ